MVFRDIYQNPTKRLASFEEADLAPPMDRFLANFFDFVFHIPFFTFILSFIVYRLNLLEVTLAASTERLAVFGQIAWITLVGTIILQAIYLKLWMATPGMKLLKLRLHTLREEPLTWGQCLLRSTAWAMQFFFLGVPFLEIFAHHRRQGLHDRVSETEIRTEKARGVMAPLAAEKASVHFLLTLFLMIFLGWATALFSGVQQSLVEGSLALSEWRDGGRLCSSVDDISSYSDLKLDDLETRLDFSMSLFLLEQIDRDCFRNEVNLSLNKSVQSPLVWVAQSHLSHFGSDERAQYQQKACEMDARWCSKSLYLEKAPLAEALSLLSSARKPASEDGDFAYLTTQMILFKRLGETQTSSKIAAILQKKGLRATGLVSEQLGIEKQKNPQALGSILDSIHSVISEKDFLRINANLCLRQLEAGCEDLGRVCTDTLSMVTNNRDALSDLMVQRVVLKNAICERDFIAPMELWSSMTDASVQELSVIGMEWQQRKNLGRSLVRLRHFIKDEANSEELRYDALQFLLRESNSPQDWDYARALWSQLSWTESLYLGATQWMVRQGLTTKDTNFFKGFPKELSQIPGLKKDIALYDRSVRSRLPASRKESF